MFGWVPTLPTPSIAQDANCSTSDASVPVSQWESLGDANATGPVTAGRASLTGVRIHPKETLPTHSSYRRILEEVCSSNPALSKEELRRKLTAFDSDTRVLFKARETVRAPWVRARWLCKHPCTRGDGPQGEEKAVQCKFKATLRGILGQRGSTEEVTEWQLFIDAARKVETPCFEHISHTVAPAHGKPLQNTPEPSKAEVLSTGGALEPLELQLQRTMSLYNDLRAEFEDWSSISADLQAGMDRCCKNEAVLMDLVEADIVAATSLLSSVKANMEEKIPAVLAHDADRRREDALVAREAGSTSGVAEAQQVRRDTGRGRQRRRELLPQSRAKGGEAGPPRKAVRRSQRLAALVVDLSNTPEDMGNFEGDIEVIDLVEDSDVE